MFHKFKDKGNITYKIIFELRFKRVKKTDLPLINTNEKNRVTISL